MGSIVRLRGRRSVLRSTRAAARCRRPASRPGMTARRPRPGRLATRPASSGSKAQVSGDDLLVTFSASAVSGVGALLELVSGEQPGRRRRLGPRRFARGPGDGRSGQSGRGGRGTVGGWSVAGPSARPACRAAPTARPRRSACSATPRGRRRRRPLLSGSAPSPSRRRPSRRIRPRSSCVSGDAQTGAVGAELADSLRCSPGGRQRKRRGRQGDQLGGRHGRRLAEPGHRHHQPQRVRLDPMDAWGRTPAPT